MMKENGQQKPPDRSLPLAFSDDLRGRQSVRATFKLTESCINAIHIVAAHMGIKQKSLFDQLRGRAGRHPSGQSIHHAHGGGGRLRS
ncbi:MAG: hypothetical protein R6X05_10835, partial [Desulfobacterales bacterium]